jgi:LPXTG-motif cell wall-anchored protein
MTAGVVAGSALCLVLAGPASADSGTPSPLPTAAPSTPALAATVAPTPSATTPGSPSAPIEVPAGNARTAPGGGDTSALTLLGAGGVLVAGAGVLATRRRA